MRGLRSLARNDWDSLRRSGARWGRIAIRHTAVVCIWYTVSIRSYQSDEGCVGLSQTDIFGSLGKPNDCNVPNKGCVPVVPTVPTDMVRKVYDDSMLSLLFVVLPKIVRLAK